MGVHYAVKYEKNRQFFVENLQYLHQKAKTEKYLLYFFFQSEHCWLEIYFKNVIIFFCL